MFGNAIGFPILTFDEAKLAPSWGYVFDARWLEPFESVVSILWKLVWINRLAGHSVVTHVARNSVNPYIGIGTTLTELDGKYLASVLAGCATQSRSAIRPKSDISARRESSAAVLRPLHGTRLSQRVASI